jgi:hypothetical protein
MRALSAIEGGNSAGIIRRDKEGVICRSLEAIRAVAVHSRIERIVSEGVKGVNLVGLEIKRSSNCHKGKQGACCKSGSIVVGKDRVLLQLTTYTKASFKFGEDATCVAFLGITLMSSRCLDYS